MKKRIIAMALTAILAIIVTACGGSSSATQSVDVQDSSNVVEASSETTNQESSDGTFKVGWSGNMLSHEYYQRVLSGMENKAKELGIEFTYTDSNSDVNKQIADCESLIANGVDAIIISPVDSNALASVVSLAKEKGVFLVSESNRVDGIDTLVAIDNALNGRMVGEWLGKTLNEKGIEGKILLIGLPEFEDCYTLAENFTEALKESGAKYEIIEVNGKGMKETAMQQAADALIAHPDINVIYGINDDSALGGSQEYMYAGKDLSKLICLTNGIEGNAAAVAMLEDGTLTGGSSVFPELIGQTAVQAVYDAHNGAKLSDFVDSPSIFISKDNYLDYYIKEGDNYVLNYDAVAELQ